jgi:hypothetical protein
MYARARTSSLSDGIREEHPMEDAANRPQDPLVQSRRPDPSTPPLDALTMVGFLGDSDRPGHRRLYFTRDLDYYAEFQVDDALLVETIPPDSLPFLGFACTRLILKRDAIFDTVRTRTPRPVDEYDIDVRLERRAARPLGYADTGPHCISGEPCSLRCETHDVATCDTCPGQATCHAATCVTCQTQCQQQTCQANCTYDTCVNTCWSP